MSNYEYLNCELFPEIVDVFRFDVDERIESGLNTARTLIAQGSGKTAMHVFFELDVMDHTASSFESRLEAPSVSAAGVGSPFISGSLRIPNLKIDPNVIDKTSLFKLKVPRYNVIVPKYSHHLKVSGEDWQRTAPEVLVVGDIEPEAIERIGPARDFQPVNTNVANSEPPSMTKLQISMNLERIFHFGPVGLSDRPEVKM